jgi:carboxyl-terminal processing protease
LVQSPVELSDGSAIRLTIARYYTPSGRSIQKKYELGKGDEYERDLINRFTHGEFDSADSIQMNDSLQYKTSIGRPVYGGGGVMPDHFVPRDTIGMTSYYTNVMNNGLVYQFAFNYADRNRDKLTSFKTYQELYAYLKTQPLLADFTNYAATKGIKKRATLINISGGLITNLIQAYVVRNLFDDNGFYPILLEDDPTVNKAIEIIKAEESTPQPPVVVIDTGKEIR